MPRNVTITFSDGPPVVYKNVPDTVDVEQVERRVAKQYPGKRVVSIDGGKQGPGRLASFGAGEAAGIANVAIGAGNLINRVAAAASDMFGVSPAQAASWAAKTFAGKSDKEAKTILRNLEKGGINSWSDLVNAGRKSLKERRAEGNKEYTQAHPNYFTAGEIVGETAASLPAFSGAGALLGRLGGAAVKAAPKAGKLAGAVKATGRAAQATGRATQTGGVGVRAVTKEAVKRGAPVAGSRATRIATRLAGGAVSGGMGAALSERDVIDSALAGSLVPIAGTMVRRGAGWTFDILSRRLGKVRAAEILRRVVAEHATDISKALKDAPDNIKANTAEFLAKMGLMTPELAAVTRIASEGSTNRALLNVAEARAAEQQAARASLRGGTTSTEAMTSAVEAKRQLRTQTDPMRETNLAAADVGRTQVLPLEAQAQQLGETAAQNVQNVRRFAPAERRLAGASDTGSLEESLANIDFLRTPEQLRMGQLATRAGNFATDQAEASLAAGQASREAQAMADDLRAQGLQPLDVSGVVRHLLSEADNAQFVNPARYRVLSEFAKNLQARAAKFVGVIDAAGLYELRKNMGQVVSDILGPTEPKALQAHTAQIIGETTPLIDNAIEAAGGKGWRDYLKTFSDGMKKIERQQFEAKVADLPEDEFRRVMSGNAPELVAEHFGPGRFDINIEMQGPKLAGAKDLAAEFGAQRAVNETGLVNLSDPQKLGFSAGVGERVKNALSPGMANAFMRGMSRISGGMPGIYGVGSGADQLSQQFSGKLYENVMRELTPALASPAKARDLLGVQSASQIIGDATNGLSPGMKNAIAQMAQRYASSGPMVSAPAQSMEGSWVFDPATQTAMWEDATGNRTANRPF